MSLLFSPAKRGHASCLAFGLAVTCFVAVALLTTTMPPPTGGGEFRGLNNMGRVMAAMGLLMATWALSGVGCVLGILGLRQPGEKTASIVGVFLNALAAGALTLWFASQ